MKAIGAALVVVISLGACSSSGAPGRSAEPSSTPEKSQTQVSLNGIAFEPDVLEIEPGTSVTWTNEDDILHTVTSGVGKKQGVPGVSEDVPGKPDGRFEREMDGAGATFTFTFEEAGTFPYFCAIHAGMTGTVVVE